MVQDQVIFIDADKKNLLKFARKILQEALKDDSLRNRFDWAQKFYPTFSAKANLPCALFVTIKDGKTLRGCVGTVLAELPLLSAAAKMVLQSAFSDPRFPPLTIPEFSRVQLEISILSPMKKINNLNEIIPFEHGVYIRKGTQAGLFLPQVWETLPREEDFLRELCFSKARLPLEALKDAKTEIYVFTAQVIEENDCA